MELKTTSHVHKLNHPKIKLHKNVIIREREMRKRNKKPNKKGKNNQMIEIESNLGPT